MLLEIKIFLKKMLHALPTFKRVSNGSVIILYSIQILKKKKLKSKTN